MQQPHSSTEGYGQISSAKEAGNADYAPIVSVGGLSYEVHTNGDVTYSRDGEAILRDRSQDVSVLKIDDDNIEVALRLSVEKFGGFLSLTGKDSFKHSVVRVAVERGVHVDFSDVKLMAYKREIEAMRDAAREATRRSTEAKRGAGGQQHPPIRTSTKSERGRAVVSKDDPPAAVVDKLEEARRQVAMKANNVEPTPAVASTPTPVSKEDARLAVRTQNTTRPGTQPEQPSEVDTPKPRR